MRKYISALERVATRCVVLGAALCLSGCLERPIGVAGPQTTNLIVERVTQDAVDKIDLLFMIDNSASMGDKQAILQLAVPVLVERLVNPLCVHESGMRTQPATADDECPADARREFKPLKDIHVGIITSSMGDAGAGDGCVQSASDPTSAQRVDDGYLLGSLPRVGDVGGDFLTWDGTDVTGFVMDFRSQVGAAGEQGCGLEASLEAWYHFLIDPAPWSEIEAVDCPGQPAGSAACRRPKIQQADGSLGDPLILAQRAAFLRPDSLVAVIMLTDENDCSIAIGGQSNIVAQTSSSMFKGSPGCAVDPNDRCCFSCGAVSQPQGCAPCEGSTTLPTSADPPNLRCFEQKRRFGVDFLYPVERYVNALSSPTLCISNANLDPNACDSATNVMANPLFEPGDTGRSRDPSLVFFAGIVGVPWQLIQDPGDPDANPLPPGELHFQSAEQLSKAVSPGGITGWERIAGTPDVRDVHMLESVADVALPPRPGLPDATRPLADPISGHDFTTPRGDDLQYACIFPLPGGGRDCSDPEYIGSGRHCDCALAGEDGYTDDNPLCWNGAAFSVQQTSAKAYPGLRHLEALEKFSKTEGTSIVASICARNVDETESTAQDFGYNPAVSAIVDRLKEKLTDKCLARQLDVEDVDGERRGKPSCSIVEASGGTGAACTCEQVDARKLPNENAARAVRKRLAEAGACPDTDPTCQTTCLCELLPAGGVVNDAGGVFIPAENQSVYAACQSQESAQVDGWCYVDADIDVITGDESLNAAKDAFVDKCPATEKRVLRFQGAGALRKGSTTYIACRGASLEDKEPAMP